MPSSSETQLSGLLGSVQPAYRHPDLTKRDVLALLHHYKGLTPKPDKFMFNDGRERELLHLRAPFLSPTRETSNIKSGGHI